MATPWKWWYFHILSKIQSLSMCWNAKQIIITCSESSESSGDTSDNSGPRCWSSHRSHYKHDPQFLTRHWEWTRFSAGSNRGPLELPEDPWPVGLALPQMPRGFRDLSTMLDCMRNQSLTRCLDRWVIQLLISRRKAEEKNSNQHVHQVI